MQTRGGVPHSCTREKRRTPDPRSSSFTATSSPVSTFRISWATPKLPLPNSLICRQRGKRPS